ncbi:MAG: hypothetical protein AAFZ15_34075 [Bacteroidota bacterium]
MNGQYISRLTSEHYGTSYSGECKFFENHCSIYAGEEIDERRRYVHLLIRSGRQKFNENLNLIFGNMTLVVDGGKALSLPVILIRVKSFAKKRNNFKVVHKLLLTRTFPLDFSEELKWVKSGNDLLRFHGKYGQIKKVAGLYNCFLVSKRRKMLINFRIQIFEDGSIISQRKEDEIKNHGVIKMRDNAVGFIDINLQISNNESFSKYRLIIDFFNKTGELPNFYFRGVYSGVSYKADSPRGGRVVLIPRNEKKVFESLDTDDYKIWEKGKEFEKFNEKYVSLINSYEGLHEFFKGEKCNYIESPEIFELRASNSAT